VIVVQRDLLIEHQKHHVSYNNNISPIVTKILQFNFITSYIRQFKQNMWPCHLLRYTRRPHTLTYRHRLTCMTRHAVMSRDGIAVNHRECDTTCNGDRATALKQKISLSRRLSMPFPVKSCGKSGLSTAITNMVKKEPHPHQNLTVYILYLNSRVGLAKVIFAILELHIWLCCPYT